MDAYADVLISDAGGTSPCADWELFSMPPGASAHLDQTEQLILAQWFAVVAPL